MKTKTLVQDSVEVIRVITLHEGDVYKRLIPPRYENDSARLAFGLVTGTMNNGEQMVVTAIEIDVEYGTAKVDQKVFMGETDLLLYPATPEEIALHQATVMDSLDQAVESAVSALDKARERRDRADRLFSDLRDGLGRASETERGLIDA